MMMKRKWFKKKRFWLVLGLGILFLVSRMEFLKMRYDIHELTKTISQSTYLSPIFETIEIKDNAIHYLKIGNRAHLPLVVFVHGSPGALNAYQDYFLDSALLEKIDIIAVDRPGFGYSNFGKSEPSLYVQAELIATILRKYAHQKVVLVGHSMGGPVIAKLAIEFPKLVAGLLMVAPSISPKDEPSNGWRKVVNFPLIRWFTPPALRVCNQEIIPLKEELELMMAGWENLMLPVTVVQGKADQLVPWENAKFASEMLSKNPNVKIKMIEEGNHFILWSKSQLVKKELLLMTEMSSF